MSKNINLNTNQLNVGIVWLNGWIMIELVKNLPSKYIYYDW
jgi:hypothetical protein